MAQLAEQWPILVLVLTIIGTAGKVIQSQYERQITRLESEVDLWREVALRGNAIAEAVTTAAEREKRSR